MRSVAWRRLARDQPDDAAADESPRELFADPFERGDGRRGVRVEPGCRACTGLRLVSHKWVVGQAGGCMRCSQLERGDRTSQAR